MANRLKLVVESADRLCTQCNASKPISEFYKRKDVRYHNGEYVRDQCKDCSKLEAKKSYDVRKQSLAHKEKARNWNIKKTYGITLDDAKVMLASQMGLCANRGCGKELDSWFKEKGKNTANIDHCHETGKVRGILCITCNTALGLIEQKNRMLGLVEYLNKSKLIQRS